MAINWLPAGLQIKDLPIANQLPLRSKVQRAADQLATVTAGWVPCAYCWGMSNHVVTEYKWLSNGWCIVTKYLPLFTVCLPYVYRMFTVCLLGTKSKLKSCVKICFQTRSPQKWKNVFPPWSQPVMMAVCENLLHIHLCILLLFPSVSPWIGMSWSLQLASWHAIRIQDLHSFILLQHCYPYLNEAEGYRATEDYL